MPPASPAKHENGIFKVIGIIRFSKSP